MTVPADRQNPEMRRGACPALSAPMMTGDGLLARIPLVEAISPAELAAICRLALEHGNGMIDVSARGNLQVRGLTETTAPLLDIAFRSLDLPLRDGLAVEIPPLAGLDESEIADPRPLARAIREGAANITGLAPKMSIIVDGGGRLRLSELLADIRLVAVSMEDGVRWKIMLGGTEVSGHVFNVLRETLAIQSVIDLLNKLASRGNRARGRDLLGDLTGNDEHCGGRELGLPISPLAGEMPGRAEGGSAPISSVEFVEPPPSVISPGRGEGGNSPQPPHSMDKPAVGTYSSPFGLLPLTERLHAVGLGPAFGQTKAQYLIALCEEASRLGIQAVKPALDHSLLFFGTREACEILADFAAASGFITSPTDPRAHIAACAGSPACASATIPTHEIATRAAAECGDLLDGSFRLHIAGCPKGCAHPQTSALALCGTEAGLSMIAGGKAADRPFVSIAFADTNTALRRLADLVGSERRRDETSAACLARLGPDRLATAARPGTP